MLRCDYYTFYNIQCVIQSKQIMTTNEFSNLEFSVFFHCNINAFKRRFLILFADVNYVQQHVCRPIKNQTPFSNLHSGQYESCCLRQYGLDNYYFILLYTQNFNRPKYLSSGSTRGRIWLYFLGRVQNMYIVKYIYLLYILVTTKFNL